MMMVIVIVIVIVIIVIVVVIVIVIVIIVIVIVIFVSVVILIEQQTDIIVYSIMSTKQAAIITGIDNVKCNIQSLLDDVKAKEDEHIKNIKAHSEAYATKVKEHDEAYAKKVKSLSDDKEQWEKEKSIIASSHTFEARIKIDVGGTHFTTTSATLTRFPDTMLGAMFSGRHNLVIDESGHYFIDRDGTHFRHILNYLRCPEDFDVSAIDAGHVKEMKKEAEYYGFGDLMFPVPEEIEAKDKNGQIVVCKKEDGIWKCMVWGGKTTNHSLYYCRVCKSACRHLSRNHQSFNSSYILNFDSLVENNIDQKQPAPTQCVKCHGF